MTGRGDVNTYALFAELFANLARDRAGVIVPTGIATDATTAPFFAALVEEQRLARLVDFENRAGLFPAVDSRMKFSLLTLGRDEGAARFAFFLTDPTQLAEPERSFTLSPEAIAAINPNTKTAPVFRSRADAELTAKVYARVPVLIDEAKRAAGNIWNIGFTTMFHMSNDSNLFRTAIELQTEGFSRVGTHWVRERTRFVPLYEAKMIYFYDHRSSGYGERAGERGYRVLPETSLEQHSDPKFEVDPYYWVPEFEVDKAIRDIPEKWLFGFKNVTSPTNERTMICSLIPRFGVGHSMPIVSFLGQMKASTIALVSCLSSIPFDFISRQKISGVNFTFFFLKQLPVPSPGFYTEARLVHVASRVLELTYTSCSMTPFARDLGYDGPPFPWDEERRALLRAELDAFYGRAYGLTRDELRYILDPADVMGPDYPSETFRVLKENEIRRHGEFRTRRLVLEAWDRMEAAGEFKALGL